MSNTRRLSRRSSSLVALAAVAILVALGGSSAAHALNQARLYGTITDENEKPVEGVLLTVTTPEQPSFKLEVRSDAKGNWAVTILDATKSYNYKYEKPGHQTMQQDFKVPIGTNARKDFQMLSDAEAIKRGAVDGRDHGFERGALGLIINKPSDLHLKHLFDKVDLPLRRPDLSDALVFHGGPVQTERGFVLHEPLAAARSGADDSTYASTMVIPGGLEMTTSRDVLEAVKASVTPKVIDCPNPASGKSEIAAVAKDGIQVLAISCDPMYALRAWADADGYFFPLLSDFWPHGAVTRDYGVFDESGGMPVRGTFLIDATGTIRWTLINPPSVGRDFSGLQEALRELRA